MQSAHRVFGKVRLSVRYRIHDTGSAGSSCCVSIREAQTEHRLILGSRSDDSARSTDGCSSFILEAPSLRQNTSHQLEVLDLVYVDRRFSNAQADCPDPSSDDVRHSHQRRIEVQATRQEE